MSWLSGVYVPMWLNSRVAGTGRVWNARLIGLTRLASIGVFRIVCLGPNGHREILQFDKLPSDWHSLDGVRLCGQVFHSSVPQSCGQNRFSLFFRLDI